MSHAAGATSARGRGTRAFVVVVDAMGAGPLPDSADYGDAGADTLGHVARAVGGLRLPALQRLGLGNMRPLAGVAAIPEPAALHGRLHRLGPGKDSTTGHWELMGVVPDGPLPTYPDGFHGPLLDRLEAIAGRRFCCNQPYGGLAAIDDYASHHLTTGEPILYTSQDSVLQIAAHDDVLAEERLHGLCAEIRAAMVDGDAVGRVIARPFTGRAGAFVRTDGRRDFTVAPPARSYLDELTDSGLEVHAVGKTADLFAGVGITARHPGATNAVALAETDRLVDELERGLVFTNLIETDQVYGHRKDVEGFHAALRAIDAAVAGWLSRLRETDLLVVTADHGVDPDAAHADHTRELVPLLAAFAGHGGRSHHGPMADVGASVLAWLAGRSASALPGDAFL